MDDEIELSGEEQEWMKTPLGASMLVKGELLKAAEQARKCIAMADTLRAKIGDTQFRDTYPDIARQAEEMRQWLASYEKSLSRVAEN